MKEYSVYVVVKCEKYLGKVQAVSDDEAKSFAQVMASQADVSQCHFSAEKVEPQIIDVRTEI